LKPSTYTEILSIEKEKKIATTAEWLSYPKNSNRGAFYGDKGKCLFLLCKIKIKKMYFL